CARDGNYWYFDVW
nr:immunoglobulin heavy chain junction region [Mus musculus]MBK4198624.1 immunoglobulin heavy chain junction region [Mus musculus]